MRTIALAEGMDPDHSPSMLYTAVRMRVAERMRLERDRATTLYNMSCFGIVHGKDMSYWDVAGHLYPASYVKEQREAAQLRAMKAEQLRFLAEIEQHQAVEREKRKLRGDHAK